MPYFITDSAPTCDGWATVKADGETIGCHTTKQGAIDQMVAASLAEDIEPGGERSMHEKDMFTTKAEALSRADEIGCEGAHSVDENGEIYYMPCATHATYESLTGGYEDRALAVPEYIQAAAKTGLMHLREGHGGDGLTDQTIREARLLASGQVSDDKIIRANAWGARHAVDLQAAKNSNADDKEFPGAGAVAHYLWGINPLDPMPARDWFERQAETIKEETNREIPVSIETRELVMEDFEIRAQGDGMSFRGYAAVFNSDSEPLPFIERIQYGAFKKSLKSKNNIRMYVNHDDTLLLASTRSNTLRLMEDEKGLLAEADLPNTTTGRDLAVLLETRVADSMSFGFSVPRGGDNWSPAGDRRTLTEVRLHEVSVVTGQPAYAATSANVRKLAHRTDSDPESLALALAALESDEGLTDEQASLLRGIVDILAPKIEAQKDHGLVLAKQMVQLMALQASS